MAIHRLLQNAAFDPEHVDLMVGAFQDVCRELKLSVRDDALCELIARAVFECAQKGVRDPHELRRCARDALQAA